MKCDHCYKELEDDGNELPSSNPGMTCVAIVCDECYTAGCADSLGSLRVLEAKYVERLAKVRAKIAQFGNLN